MSPQELLRELVAIPSVSSMSNRPVVERLQRFFEGMGWHERVLRYVDAAGVEKLNLIVSPWEMGEGRVEAELAIVCHTDTVPFEAGWEGATELRERDGMLHGCGACDVKGFLACMMAVVAGMDCVTLQRRLCLVFTSDEEVGCRGARYLLEDGALRARYAIVGEPTSLVPARAGKGYCLAKVLVKGVAAHSAYPEAGRSAIFAAGRLLGEIEQLAREMMEFRDEAFSPPWTTLNVGEIHGGTAKNVVPAECWFLVEWRPIPGQRPELVLDGLRGMVERVFPGQGDGVGRRARGLGETRTNAGILRYAQDDGGGVGRADDDGGVGRADDDGGVGRVDGGGGERAGEGPADGLRVEIEVLRMEQGFETSVESAVVRAVKGDADAPVQTIAFGTEAPWMAKMGAEAVVIGPGSMLTAHSSRECVPSAELDACVRVLRDAIERLCGRFGGRA